MPLCHVLTTFGSLFWTKKMVIPVDGRKHVQVPPQKNIYIFQTYVYKRVSFISAKFALNVFTMIHSDIRQHKPTTNPHVAQKNHCFFSCWISKPMTPIFGGSSFYLPQPQGFILTHFEDFAVVHRDGSCPMHWVNIHRNWVSDVLGRLGAG